MPAPAEIGARGGLWRHRDFRRLWAAESLSLVGTEISHLALPLVAISVLDASTFQVGLITVLDAAAFLLVGLPAGAWCDRLPRRPVLILGDLARAVLLASIPVAALFGALTIWQLYAVVLASGFCTVFFDVAYQSYLPGLVGREHLIEGNAKLEASRSVAHAVGPTVSGYLVQWFTAPIAVAVDAVTYLWSAAWIAAIRTREPRPKTVARSSLRGEVLDGLRFVFGHPVLRTLAVSGSVWALFLAAQSAIAVVFLVRELGVRPATVGVLYSAASVGAVLGALVAARLTRWLGRGRALVGYAGASGAFGLLLPLTDTGWRLVLFALSGAVVGACITAYNIVHVSFRQALCPDHLLGRMNATMRFVMWGAIPIGGVLGGALGTGIGLRPTLWVTAVGLLVPVLCLYLSPVRQAAVESQPL
jgi:MFS family permease